MIKAILFDLDGVVIDSEPLYEKVENELFKRYGIFIPDKELKLFKGITETEFYDLLEKRHSPNWDRQEVITEGRCRLMALFTSDLRFMPGFMSLMHRIGGLYLTGLVTSSSREVFGEVCRILPIEEVFKEIVCADDISDGKPHPEPYITMMKRLSVVPEEVMVIEDSVHGIASAKASGARCVALTSSLSRNELLEADEVVDSLYEIDEALINTLMK